MSEADKNILYFYIHGLEMLIKGSLAFDQPFTFGGLARFGDLVAFPPQSACSAYRAHAQNECRYWPSLSEKGVLTKAI